MDFDTYNIPNIFRHVGGLQRSYTSQRSTISNITKSEMIELNEMNGASITTTRISLEDQSSVSFVNVRVNFLKF